jgi:hypothetical protein
VQRPDESGANSLAAEVPVNVDPMKLRLLTERVVVQVTNNSSIDLADEKHRVVGTRALRNTLGEYCGLVGLFRNCVDDDGVDKSFKLHGHRRPTNPRDCFGVVRCRVANNKHEVTLPHRPPR